MLSKSLVFVLVATVWPFSAFSDEAQIVDKPQTIFRDSSEHNRMNKKFSLTYMAFGVGPNRSGSIGGTASLLLNRNASVDFEYVSGRPLYTNWFSWSDYDVRTSSYGIHYKQFTGNSFYFRVGADYRTVKYRYTSRDIFTGEVNSTNRFEADSVTATILIGNQWQWENFTLGCDWIGVALPVTTHITSESVSGPYPNPQYMKEDQDWLVKNSASIGLRFYLGASF